MGVSQNQGYLFRGPYKKDYSIWGLYWGPPIEGNYPIGIMEKWKLLYYM